MTNLTQIQDSKRAYNTLQDYAGFIPASVYQAAGWRSQVITHPCPSTKQLRRAIRFTTTSGGRIRFMDGHKPAYTNIPGYKRSWYRLGEAVSYNQPLVICNGESSVVTAQYCGLAATAITGGEKSSIPNDLLAQLKAAYPSGRVIVALDCDNTGHKAGQGITRQLIQAGYDAVMVDLGLSDGGDLRDFCAIYRDEAMQQLLALPAQVIPKQAPPKPMLRPANMQRQTGDLRHIKEEIIPAALGITDRRVNKDGFTIKRIANPFESHEHDHKAPGSVYNFETGVMYDHKGGYKYSFKELCSLLNIALPSRKQADVRVDLSAVPDDVTNKAWFPYGLPDSWRTALLTYYPGYTAPFIEMLNQAVRQGLLDPDDFTIEDVIAANMSVGAKMSESTLRNRAIPELRGHFLSDSNTSEGYMFESDKNSIGRPQTHYRLLSLSDVKAQLMHYAMPQLVQKHHPTKADSEKNIKPVLVKFTDMMLEAIGVDVSATNQLNTALADAYAAQNYAEHNALWRAKTELLQLEQDLGKTYSTPFPAQWQYGTQKAYRAAFLRATFDTAQELGSRRQIRTLLGGISTSSVDTCLKDAGIGKETDQYQEATLKNPHNIGQQARVMNAKIHGMPKYLVVENAKGRVIHHERYSAQANEFVSYQMKQGNTVKICFQTANKHFIERESPPPPPKPRPKPAGQAHISIKSSQSVSGGRKKRVEPQPLKAGYNAKWVHEQLHLGLRLLGWRTDYDRYVNLQTGEIVRIDGDIKTFIHLLLTFIDING